MYLYLEFQDKLVLLKVHNTATEALNGGVIGCYNTISLCQVCS